MSEESANIDELVKAYLNIRTERERISGIFEAEDQALKDVQEKLKSGILHVCNTLGVESLKTTMGVASKVMRERYYTNDWDNFGKFIIERNLVALLERRIHQGNFKEYMLEHKEEGLPPGVNAMREYDIQVRKNK